MPAHAEGKQRHTRTKGKRDRRSRGSPPLGHILDIILPRKSRPFAAAMTPDLSGLFLISGAISGCGYLSSIMVSTTFPSHHTLFPGLLCLYSLAWLCIFLGNSEVFAFAVWTLRATLFRLEARHIELFARVGPCTDFNDIRLSLWTSWCSGGGKSRRNQAELVLRRR